MSTISSLSRPTGYSGNAHRQGGSLSSASSQNVNRSSGANLGRGSSVVYTPSAQRAGATLGSSSGTYKAGATLGSGNRSTGSTLNSGSKITLSGLGSSTQRAGGVLKSFANPSSNVFRSSSTPTTSTANRSAGACIPCSR